MAMNKSERAALDLAQRELAIARALRWSRYEPVPKDLPAPEPFGYARNYTEGWATNTYTKSVNQEWSEPSCHGSGPYPAVGRHRSASQRGKSLYSTRLLALQALRYEVERAAAQDLAEIDAEIEAELNGAAQAKGGAT